MGTVYTLVVILHVVFSLGLIAVVLLQSGKTAGLGVIGGGAQTLFKKRRGLDALLSKLSTMLAVLFMATALVLTVIKG